MIDNQYKEIESLYDFIKNKGILQSKPSSENIKEEIVIKDFDLAFDLAEKQNALEEDGLCWQDIKELEESKIREKFYNEPNYVQIKTLERTLFNELIHLVRDNLPEQYKEIYEEIAGDLTISMLNIIFNNNLNRFYKNIYNKYVNGYFPCGWEGEYPNGKMILFENH